MALPYKQGKIALVLREMNNTGTEYEINGIDLDTSVFMWRKPQETYTVIPTSSYSISESSNVNTLVITDTETLSKIERLQIISIINNEASTYDPSYKVDVTTLKDHYNALVESFSEMFEYIKNTVIVADGQDYSIVLPTLNEGEVWVKTEDSWRGFYIGDIENQVKELRELIENSRVSAIRDIENKRDSSLESIEEEGTTQVNKVKDEGTTQTGLVTDEGTTQVNKVKTTGAERITEQGNFQVNRVKETGDTKNEMLITTGNTQNTRVTGTGNFQNERIITTGNGKVYDVTKEGDKQVTRVTGVGNTKVSEVTSEGTTQIGKVKTEGTKQISLVTDEGDYQANRLMDLGTDGIYQKPLDSIYGSISARNGRLYTSGAFNNIHGIESANVLEYGDSKIITTPDNSFNAIVEKDKLYVGPRYKNLATENPTRILTDVIYDSDSKTMQINVDTYLAYEKATLASELTPKGRYRLYLDYTINTDNITDKVDISSYYGSNYIDTTVGNHIINTDIIIGSDRTSIILSTLPTVGSDISITFNKIMVIEGAEEKPFIPPQYTFPDGALSFDGTEGLRLYRNSGLIKNAKYSETENVIISHEDAASGDCAIINKKSKEDVCFSALYESDVNIIVNDNPTQSNRLKINYWNKKGLHSFSQFVFYKGSLTQAELEAELAKNLFLEGEVDVISQIQTDMKVGAILGKRPQGNIDDGTLHKVGEIWYSNKLGKYYECITQNSDNYIDAEKWAEKSLEALEKEVDAGAKFGSRMSGDLYGNGRSHNVTYTNGERFRIVYLWGTNGSNGSFHVYINGVRVTGFNMYGSDSGGGAGGTFIVPPNATYKVYVNSATLYDWYEYD